MDSRNAHQRKHRTRAEMRQARKKGVSGINPMCQREFHYDNVIVKSLELVFSVLFFWYLGSLVDEKLQTGPVGMLSGLVLGFIIGIRLVCWNYFFMGRK